MVENIPELLKSLLPKALLEQCRIHTFEKNDCLFHQGKKPVSITGEAVLSRVSNRGETTVLQRRKGGFLSEASLYADLYHCDAIATQTGTAITLPIGEMKIALNDVSFSQKWIQLLSKEIMRLRTQSERLSLKDIKSKLIHLIETEGSDGVLNLQSDFKSLAAEIGVTHEALYRAIATLDSEGILKKSPISLELLKNKKSIP